MERLEVVLEGLAFPEAPRWHEGRFWFSDMHAHEVMVTDLDGRRETVVEVPQQPSGLGWLPDGRLLVVSMVDRRLLRLDGGGLTEVADLTPWAGFHCNDMVVDHDGRAYVGNFGFDHYRGQPVTPARLVRVDPDGSVTVVDEHTLFPNGMVVTPDGGTLVVGETYGRRLTAWDRRPDGSLTGRRLFADLAPGVPDGICLDAEGAIWVADPRAHEVLRVLEGGEVTDRVPTGERGAYACMLGGDDRRTLLVCTALASGPVTAQQRAGRIEATRVPVPGAGLP
jgi:sugar lactone lactonase YvrE